MKIYLVFKIRVVSVVSDGIIFHVVLNINVAIAFSDKIIFYSVSKISVINLVRDGITFHVVLNISVVSVVSDSL